MRYLVLCALLVSLNSCNTTIGIYRDTKAVFLWTKGKIQGAGDGGGNVDSGSGVDSGGGVEVDPGGGGQAEEFIY